MFETIKTSWQDPPFNVTDLKQWVYCKRILYFHIFLPKIRPKTFKMEEGREAGKQEEKRERRRSLQTYGIKEGRKEFNVLISSSRYGLIGKIDMVIVTSDEVIPVDYKYSLRGTREHFKLQLTAYGVLLEETYSLPARCGFIYSIPSRQAMEVQFTEDLRTKFYRILEDMHRMLYNESMPDPVKNKRACMVCEFRRFCNDVL